MEALALENNPDSKKKLFELILNERFGGLRDVTSIHSAQRLVSMLADLSDIVAINTSPLESTKPLVDHLTQTFMLYGVSKEQIKIQDYQQTLGGKHVTQYNFLAEFPASSEHFETVVASGHLDSISINLNCFSMKKEDVLPYFGRLEVRKEPTTIPEPGSLDKKVEKEMRAYAFAGNDMKNIFTVMTQLLKERVYQKDPERFIAENEWVFDCLDEKSRDDYLGRIRDRPQELFHDFLKDARNKLIFAGTAGEELAGHQGLKAALKRNPDLRFSDIWLIAEPSSGLSDSHKGYTSVKVSIDENTEIRGVPYNPLEQALLLIERINFEYQKKELVEPFHKKDKQLGFASLNVAPIKGKASVSGDYHYVKITFKGVGAHSSKHENGENAIFFASDVYSNLKKIYEEDISIAFIDGGTKRNQVPDSCQLTIAIKKERLECFQRDVKNQTKIVSSNYPRGSTEISDVSSHEEYDIKDGVVFECEYRIIKGQDVKGIEKGVSRISTGIGIKSRVVTERDSYNMEPRFNDLDEKTQEALLLAANQEKPKPVSFSTEGGTITNLVRGTVPIILSTTSIAQAHTDDKEYVTLDQLEGQFRLYYKALQYLLKNTIKGPKKISATSTIDRLVETERLSHVELRDHLNWYKEHETSRGIFALIDLTQYKHMTDEKLRKLNSILRNFSEVLDLHPAVVINRDYQKRIGSGFEKEIVVFSDSDNIPNRIVNLVRTNVLPVIVSEKFSYENIKYLVSELAPLKHLIISENGGITDSREQPVSLINLNEIITAKDFPGVDEMKEFIGILKDLRFNGKCYDDLFHAYQLFSKYHHDSMRPDQIKFGSIQIVSLDNLMAELFNTDGAATLIRSGYDIEIKKDKHGKIYSEKDRLAEALVIRKKDLGEVGIISRFYIDPSFTRQNLPESMMREIIKTNPFLMWTSVEDPDIGSVDARIIKYVGGKDRNVMNIPFVNNQGERIVSHIVGLNPLSSHQTALIPQLMDEAFHMYPITYKTR